MLDDGVLTGVVVFHIMCFGKNHIQNISGYTWVLKKGAVGGECGRWLLLRGSRGVLSKHNNKNAYFLFK